MKNFSFVKNRKIFFIFTALVIVAGIVSFIVNGFNFDIEFVGGTEITYDLGKPVEGKDEDAIKKMVIDEIGKDDFSSLRIVGDNKDTVVIRTTLVDEQGKDAWDKASKAVEDAVKAKYPDMTVVSTDGNSLFTLFKAPAPAADADANTPAPTAPAATETDRAAVEEAVKGVVPAADVKLADGNVNVSFDVEGQISQHRENISEGIKKLYPNAQWQSTDTVSAEVSDNLKKTAVISAVLAIVLMLVYVAFRFEFSSALAAVCCLAHDVFIMIIAYSLFQIPVGSTIIATILTILGYSINATIIIFDRVRENVKQMPANVTFAEKVDDGIKSTLMRSVNTSFTTLITIGLIYFMGVTSIKNFALPIIVGIIAGAYSSICLSGNLWVLFKGKKKRSK